MAEHFAQEFNLDQLAAQADLSKYHFIRLFRAATEMSPPQYHIYLRLDAARKLLRETDKSVIAVALEVGYSNPSYFAQLFRRETGLSPSEYRRQRGFTVAAWGDTHGSMEGTCEGAMVVEAALVGNIRDSPVGFPQETRGGGQPSLADELARGEIKEAADEAGELRER
jgi:AraC-like DNA-binding protein